MDKRYYRDALTIGDACNLCGIVQSFARVLLALNEEMREKGKDTDWVNKHPISKVFADKIYDLSSAPRDFYQAYQICMDAAEDGDEYIIDILC